MIVDPKELTSSDKIKRHYLDEAIRFNEKDENSRAYCEIDLAHNLCAIFYKKENDQLHRDRGPAIIRWDYNKRVLVQEYYLDGKLHRIDGPAIFAQSPYKDREIAKYYFHGKEFSRENHIKLCKGKLIDGGLGRVFV